MAASHKLEIVYRPLAEIRRYEKNARTHTPQQIAKLKKSLARFGWTNALLIADGELLCGHARIDAAIEMAGEGEPIRGNADSYLAPTVDLSHLSKSERRAYILADNRIAIESGWDGDLLQTELKALADEGFDLSLTGFNMPELSQWMSEETFGDPEKEWTGMPGFEQKDKMAFKSLTVNFPNQDAISKFSALVGQLITDKTRFIWFPQAERQRSADLRYISDDESSVPDLHTVEE